MKIFGISSGCYSDFGYVAFFSNKEKAEKFLAKNGKFIRDVNQYVSEFELDPDDYETPEYVSFYYYKNGDNTYGPAIEYSCEVSEDEYEKDGDYESATIYVKYDDNESKILKAFYDKLNIMRAKNEGVV